MCVFLNLHDFFLKFQQILHSYIFFFYEIMFFLKNKIQNSLELIITINKMKINEYYNIVLKPELERIGNYNLLKWGIYLLEIWTASKIFGTIYDRLRFRIGNNTYCFAYGNASKCNYGVQMTFLGLLVSVYTLTLSVFSEYINVPPIMKWSDIDLCAFKIGLWIVTIFTLEKWFKKKFNKAYPNGSRIEDKVKKNMRMDKMIGMDMRLVKRMSTYILLILFLSFLFLIFEKKSNIKKEKKMQGNNY